MRVILSLTLVILIVCTTWYARAQTVPQMTKVSFQNMTALNVSVWSVDPTSGEESLIGNVPAGGAISGNAVPGMELRVRLGGLGGGGALIATYVTTAAYTQDVKIAMRGNEVLLEPGYADYLGPHGPTGKPVTDSPDCSRDARSCVQPIPASTFATSCENIRVSGAPQPPTLYAECRRADGSLNHTSILIKGITNISGKLYFTGMDKPSSFQDSCINIRIGYTGSTLEAECRTPDGRFIPTYTPIPGIANNNGALVYQ